MGNYVALRKRPKPLSQSQEALLTGIRAYTRQHGFPPCIRDLLQDVTGLRSTATVDYNLKALERQGVIRRDREVARGIVLVDEDSPALLLAELWQEIAALHDAVPTLLRERIEAALGMEPA